MRGVETSVAIARDCSRRAALIDHLNLYNIVVSHM